MNYCPNCKKNIDKQVDYCPQCSTKLINKKDKSHTINVIILILVISNLIIYFSSIYIALYNEGIKASVTSPSSSGAYILLGPIIESYLFIPHIICIILIILNFNNRTQLKSDFILIFSILSLASIIFSYNERIFMLHNDNILFFVSLIECIVMIIFAFLNIKKSQYKKN